MTYFNTIENDKPTSIKMGVGSLERFEINCIQGLKTS